MNDMGKARTRRASPTAASDANNAQSQLSSEWTQNQKTLVAIENDFTNHSTGCTYSYNPVKAQAAQLYASKVRVGSPPSPFVDYCHHHNLEGPHNPHPWHNHQHSHSAVFAGHYGVPQLQPQPWPQPWPQPQTRLPATDQLGLDHSNSTGGSGSVDSILVKLCPSPSPNPNASQGPGPTGGPSTSNLETWLQQIERSHSAPPQLELEVNQQRRQLQQHLQQQIEQQQHLQQRLQQQLQLLQQPGRSPSSSPSPPYLAPHGEYVPLLVNVRKLRNDETLKAKIDNEDVLVMMDYDSAKNQMNRGYPSPHSASTPNQSPPPPGTIADASAGQEDRTDPAAVAARPKKDLFVFHVPNDMAEGEFYKLFSQYGKLRRARIQYDIMDGKKEKVSKGYGFVTFKRFSDAVVAVHSLNGYKLGEKNKKALVVTYSRDTTRPNPTNNSVSANNGTSGSSSDKRRARRVQRRLSN